MHQFAEQWLGLLFMAFLEPWKLLRYSIRSQKQVFIYAVYGVVAAVMIAYLDDGDLFNGKLSWNTLNMKAQQAEAPLNVKDVRSGSIKIQRSYNGSQLH